MGFVLERGENRFVGTHVGIKTVRPVCVKTMLFTYYPQYESVYPLVLLDSCRTGTHLHSSTFGKRDRSCNTQVHDAGLLPRECSQFGMLPLITCCSWACAAQRLREMRCWQVIQTPKQVIL